MAPSYKLHYFNLTGRGEPIRLLLSYGGIQFEDERFEYGDWPKIKPTMPLGQVPVLEIDGKPFTQTIPLCRYLGNVLNIDGKDRTENYAIDAAVEILWDILKTAYERKMINDEKIKEERTKKLQEQIPLLLGKLEEDTKRNGDFIAINRISWADIFFLSAYEDLVNLADNPFGNYPHLEQLKKNLLENKNIMEYIKNRPASKMPKNYDLKNDL